MATLTIESIGIFEINFVQSNDKDWLFTPVALKLNFSTHTVIFENLKYAYLMKKHAIDLKNWISEISRSCREGKKPDDVIFVSSELAFTMKVTDIDYEVDDGTGSVTMDIFINTQEAFLTEKGANIGGNFSIYLEDIVSFERQIQTELGQLL